LKHSMLPQIGVLDILRKFKNELQRILNNVEGKMQ